ncbi:F-box/kelch-repeat protein At3g23880-like [Quercus suber]|uniref:F-box/kelch-repeat protein At3g23880-like n=1 Tax=Quercus suber TaxID=58331 RepID=UPI0032DE4D8D
MSQPTILLRRTNNQLPEEIVAEILVRLPVKSLLRFRCVCKSWYRYIATPNFINNNLLYCNDHNRGFFIHMPKTTGSMVSFSRPHGQICTVASHHTFEAISELRIPFAFQSGYSHFVGSCNGILCFSDYRSFEFKDVYLWNPSIRKFKRLPDTCLTHLFNVSLGFGFDSQNNNYKVVRISQSTAKPMPPPEVEVYSLSSDSWKRVGLGISWRSNVVFHKFNCTLTFPFVSGNLHWMIEMIEGGGQERHFTSMILSFDVNSEKFKELPLPDDEGRGTRSNVVVYLWNPSIRKFKRLPDNRSPILKFGIRYDSQNNDFKLNLESRWDPIFFYNNVNDYKALPFVSGHLHWMLKIVGGQERHSADMLLSFDVNSEKFEQLPLPDDEGRGSCFMKFITSFKGKLALIKFESGVQPHSTLCSIWVMREYGVIDSWNKLCVLSIENFNFCISFTNDGLLLVQKGPLLVSTNGEIERKYKNVLIDPETLHEKEIGNEVDYCFDVAAYMENLVLLDGANVVSY